ncbi:TolC family protein [Thioalkalivibrio sp. ALMg13-2]|uniref:TolC family protein n=1 Tax=Thioalkalivibrio sp. ALMg13-2 TaxID=1158167 RepID=UPI00035EDE18|nr:TolC family protein [Thioalkalivibrio sp. ALMg13-2]
MLLPVVSVLFLAGCAVTAPELDRSDLMEDLSVQGIDLPESEMPRPSGELTLDEAIHQAIWRNPRMQQAYAKLDLTAADVVEASQFSNPSLSLSVMRPEGGGGNEYGVGLAWGISGLLMRGSRQEMARSHWESTRLQLAEGMVALASDTERAWYDAVAARQRAEVQRLESRAADLGARLGERFYDAGNISDLQRAHLRIRAAESRLKLEDARQREREARLRLAHLMGLPGEVDDWELPKELPLPLAEVEERQALVDQALEQRLDLRALDHALDGLTEGVALVRRYRWMGDIEPGLEFEREGDGTRLWGGGISFTLPIFNQNQAGIGRAEARLADGEARRESLVQAVTNDVHQHFERLAHHRNRFGVLQDDLLPARELATERLQERVNFMFDDVFDLLAIKQEELAAWQKTVAALGDYWQARAALAHAVAGELPGGEPGSAGTFATAQLEHEPTAMDHGSMGHGDHGAMDHGGHGGMDHGDGDEGHSGMDHGDHGAHDDMDHGQGHEGHEGHEGHSGMDHGDGDDGHSGMDHGDHGAHDDMDHGQGHEGHEGHEGHSGMDHDDHGQQDQDHRDHSNHGHGGHH